MTFFVHVHVQLMSRYKEKQKYRYYSCSCRGSNPGRRNVGPGTLPLSHDDNNRTRPIAGRDNIRPKTS